MFLGFCDDPALQLECARTYTRYKVPVRPPPLWTGRAYRHEKVRIAYLSGDLRQHATASLIARLLELHDRARFDVLGVSFSHDDNSEMRGRLVQAFDQFHDVRAASDRDVAKLLNDLEVDIAVDLKGYTQDCRPEILAHRPAPIQVNYLGYPGTMGARFHRLHHCRQDRAAVRAAGILHREDRASAGQLSGQRRTTGDRRIGAAARQEAGSPNRASYSAASTATTRSPRRCSMCG